METDATFELSPMRSAGKSMRHRSQRWHASINPLRPCLCTARLNDQRWAYGGRLEATGSLLARSLHCLVGRNPLGAPAIVRP
jgi:hypothetical protein